MAVHEANFVKSKIYRMAKECEIVGGPSLYCAVVCYTVLIPYVLTVLYTDS